MIRIFYTREFKTGTLKGIVLKGESITVDKSRAQKIIDRMNGKTRRKDFGGSWVVDTFECFLLA